MESVLKQFLCLKLKFKRRAERSDILPFPSVLLDDLSLIYKTLPRLKSYFIRLSLFP